MCTFASPLVSSPEGLSLHSASEALRQAFGSAASFAWAIGLLAGKDTYQVSLFSFLSPSPVADV